MIPRKLKKILLSFTIPLSLLSAGFAVYLFFNPEQAVFQSRRKRQQSASYAVLQEVRDIYSLNTAEYTMKVIFPFDFIEPGINWQELKYYYDTDKEAFREKSQIDYYPDRKVPVTWRYSHFYAQCRGAGYELAKAQQDFFIITATVKAGFNLENYPLLDDNKPDGDLDNFVRIKQTDDGKKILYLKKPDSVVTEFIIEDHNLSALGYPDVSLSPDQWSAIIRYLSPRIEDIVILKGILEEADRNGQQLLTQIMLGSGFDDVVYF